MKKLLPISLALLVLSGGIVACSPSGDQNPPASQEATSSPADGKKSNEQIELEMTDIAVQTDMRLAIKELDPLKELYVRKGGDSSGEFNQKSQELLNKHSYNKGTEITFEARENNEYTLKGWNEAGWKFKTKETALVYESEKGFTNAWAASPDNQ